MDDLEQKSFRTVQEIICRAMELLKKAKAEMERVPRPPRDFTEQDRITLGTILGQAPQEPTEVLRGAINNAIYTLAGGVALCPDIGTVYKGIDG